MVFLMDILFDNDSDELFEIIKLLINKKNITAKEVYKSLSKHDVKNDGI